MEMPSLYFRGHYISNESPKVGLEDLVQLHLCYTEAKLSSLYCHMGQNDCHAPLPSLTLLANPNRFRGAKPYTGTLYFLIFYFLYLLYLMHITKPIHM